MQSKDAQNGNDLVLQTSLIKSVSQDTSFKILMTVLKKIGFFVIKKCNLSNIQIEYVKSHCSSCIDQT